MLPWHEPHAFGWTTLRPPLRSNRGPTWNHDHGTRRDAILRLVTTKTDTPKGKVRAPRRPPPPERGSIPTRHPAGLSEAARDPRGPLHGRRSPRAAGAAPRKAAKTDKSLKLYALGCPSAARPCVPPAPFRRLAAYLSEACRQPKTCLEWAPAR